MTRAVIYIRTNITTQDNTSSDFDYQLQRCREFAENNGFEIISEIRGEFIDGLGLDRPSFDELKRIVANNETDVILVTDLSRISRKTDEFSEMREGFEKAGVLIHAVQ